MTLSAPFYVLALGLINWITTEVLVNSALFQEPRRAIRRFGKKIQGDGSKPLQTLLGGKLGYFVSCCLCVGVWIGFIEAAVFGGPLQPTGFWSWSGWIANGLLYKAVGHIFLQINALLHEKVRSLKLHNNINEQNPRHAPVTNGHKSENVAVLTGTQ